MQEMESQDRKVSPDETPVEDWVQSLFFKRSMGRRMLPESLPPYATSKGLILTDRRSRSDRRKPLSPKPAPTLKAI